MLGSTIRWALAGAALVVSVGTAGAQPGDPSGVDPCGEDPSGVDPCGEDPSGVDPCGGDPCDDFEDSDDYAPLKKRQRAPMSDRKLRDEPIATPDIAPARGAEDVPDSTSSRVTVFGVVDVGLSAGAVGEPISLSPDVWVGVGDDLQLGLIHSAYGSTGFFLGLAATSLCVTDGGCSDLYDNAGIEAAYRLTTGSLELAVRGGVHAVSVTDPFALAVKLGVEGAWRSGKLAVRFHPNLFVGITNRTIEQGMVEVDFNDEVLALPVTLGYPLGSAISVLVQTGVRAKPSALGDTLTVPLAVGATYAVTEQLELGGVFSLPGLVDGEDDTGALDLRSISLTASYTL